MRKPNAWAFPAWIGSPNRLYGPQPYCLRLSRAKPPKSSRARVAGSGTSAKSSKSNRLRRTTCPWVSVATKKVRWERLDHKTEPEGSIHKKRALPSHQTNMISRNGKLVKPFFWFSPRFWGNLARSTLAFWRVYLPCLCLSGYFGPTSS